jgi:hypothetical protein
MSRSKIKIKKRMKSRRKSKSRIGAAISLPALYNGQVEFVWTALLLLLGVPLCFAAGAGVSVVTDWALARLPARGMIQSAFDGLFVLLALMFMVFYFLWGWWIMPSMRPRSTSFSSASADCGPISRAAWLKWDRRRP